MWKYNNKMRRVSDICAAMCSDIMRMSMDILLTFYILNVKMNIRTLHVMILFSGRRDIMKKVLFMAAFFGAVMCAASAHAAVGDPVGKIYSTDIIATVNGEPIESYNIGGRTAVIAEDLSDKYYGFTYEYYDDTRTLYVRTSNAVAPRERGVVRGTVGQIAGDIYETDIKVIFNGNEVKGYNIGGRTAVVIEDLGTLDGTSPNEAYGYTKYLCNFTWDNDTRTVALYTPCDNHSAFISASYLYDYAVPKIQYTLKDNVISAYYDPDEAFSRFSEYSIPESFSDEQYLITPLMYEKDGVKTEIGFCYGVVLYGDVGVNVCIDRDAALPLIKSLLPSEIPSYDEVMARFSDDVNYETINRIETENYTCLLVRDKNADKNDDIRVVSVRKSGGYCILTRGTSNDDVNEISLEEGNTILYISGPMAAPHGVMTNISTTLNLDYFSYE